MAIDPGNRKAKIGALLSHSAEEPSLLLRDTGDLRDLSDRSLQQHAYRTLSPCSACATHQIIDASGTSSLSETGGYSTTSSASNWSGVGMVSPIAAAVLRLSTS